MIELRSGDIDLWLTFYDEITCAQRQDSYLLLLNPAEREQQQRFHSARDRLRYLVTRALVRTVLSRYLPLDKAAWIFANNAFGRPRIANANVLGSDLRFNIAHTHSLIVLAIVRGREVGVDVENTCVKTVDVWIADRFFARSEAAALSMLPPAQRHFRFLEHWTFKESYIKARGLGLSLPLDKFCFDFPDDRAVRISINAELQDHADRRQLWQLLPGADYLVALCAERLAAEPSRLRVTRIVPGVTERPIAPAVTRISECRRRLSRSGLSAVFPGLFEAGSERRR